MSKRKVNVAPSKTTSAVIIKIRGNSIYEVIMKTESLEEARKLGDAICKIDGNPYFYTITDLNGTELFRHVKN